MKSHELLKDPSKWTQGAFAKDKDGHVTQSQGDDAVCWCALGSLTKCYTKLGKNEYEKLLRYLNEDTEFTCASTWNDSSKTTHEEVLKVLTHLNL
tara:strand:+ start:1266 stop:1550 length:285 start_codon:yes stop_codon:yes gene_type:complete